MPPEQFTRPVTGGFRSLKATLGHLLNVEEVWMARLEGRPTPPLQPEECAAPADFSLRWSQAEQAMRRLLAGYDQETLNRPLTVTTTSGKQYQHRPWEVFLHLVNHGTHHRGQVSVMMRELGAAPPQLDLVAYLRQTGENGGA